MSEIEKLYENCNFEKSMGVGLPLALHPFTEEKQISLIKWLVKHRFNFMVYELTEKDFTFEVINKTLRLPAQFVSVSEKQFDNGLAKVLNCFWQELTEEEKQQVKEILE